MDLPDAALHCIFAYAVRAEPCSAPWALRRVCRAWRAHVCGSAPLLRAAAEGLAGHGRAAPLRLADVRAALADASDAEGESDAATDAAGSLRSDGAESIAESAAESAAAWCAALDGVRRAAFWSRADVLRGAAVLGGADHPLARCAGGSRAVPATDRVLRGAPCKAAAREAHEPPPSPAGLRDSLHSLALRGGRSADSGEGDEATMLFAPLRRASSEQRRWVWSVGIEACRFQSRFQDEDQWWCKVGVVITTDVGVFDVHVACVGGRCDVVARCWDARGLRWGWCRRLDASSVGEHVDVGVGDDVGVSFEACTFSFGVGGTWAVVDVAALHASLEGAAAAAPPAISDVAPAMACGPGVALRLAPTPPTAPRRGVAELCPRDGGCPRPPPRRSPAAA